MPDFITEYHHLSLRKNAAHWNTV